MLGMKTTQESPSPFYSFSPPTSHDASFSFHQQETLPHFPPILLSLSPTPTMPDGAVPDDPVAKAERTVERLKAEQKKLGEQITACERCKRGKVTVHDLEELDVYVDDITDATTPNGKEKINAKIVELKEKEKV